MKNKTKSLVLVGLTVLLGIIVPSANAADTPSVVEVKTYGSTYGEFSARWWQWLLSIPAAVNPNIGGDCGQGQYDDVFFLPGAFGSDPVVRTCAIPAGKPAFFPLINSLAFKPGGKDTLLDLRKLAAELIDNVTALTVTIDGEMTLNLNDLANLRVRSPSFTVIAPPKGLLAPGKLSVPGNTDPLVSDGYWLLLSPTPGTHEIHVQATTTYGTPPFALDVTYHLTWQ